MIIRKLFKFENAHIVRGCTSKRCSGSLHGHSYKVEVFFESNYLDNGQMVYDFGLMKGGIKAIIDSFDHAITIWSGDDYEYVKSMKKHSARWIELGVSPSAEQFARVFFVLIDRFFSLCKTINGEKEVNLHSIIVHETDTGYAQAFRHDATNAQMGEINLDDITISQEILLEYRDVWERLRSGQIYTNPKSV